MQRSVAELTAPTERKNAFLLMHVPPGLLRSPQPYSIGVQANMQPPSCYDQHEDVSQQCLPLTAAKPHATTSPSKL